MGHLYNGDELAKFTLYIDSTIEENSFSAKKYRKGIYKEEDNDENDTYFDYLQRIKEDLSDKIKYYNKTFEFNFEHKKKKNAQYRLTRFELLVLIFFLIYPSGNQTLISKIKNKKQYFLSEILSFYNELSTFLNDNRFQKSGSWYDYERKIIGTEPEPLLQTEITLKIKKMQNVTILKYLKEKIRERAIQAIDDGLEELIPTEVISKIPLISEIEFCEWDEKMGNGTLTLDDAEEVFSKAEIKHLNTEDLNIENLKEESFIHSGHFDKQTFDFAISSLNAFYYGNYGDENRSIYNKILTLFEYLDAEIDEYDLAAVKEINYDSLIKEMLTKYE